tara:strand:- start:124 stop:405 length:282 start_codon:yes stop_codon:yes gene_type:complete
LRKSKSKEDILEEFRKTQEELRKTIFDGDIEFIDEEIGSSFESKAMQQTVVSLPAIQEREYSLVEKSKKSFYYKDNCKIISQKDEIEKDNVDW